MGKVNYICVTKKIEETSEDSKFIVLPFYKNGEPLKDGKKWGMTLLSAGSMRFRWNEKNILREKTLKSIAEELHPHVCSGECAGDEQRCNCQRQIVSIELIHSKTVFEINSQGGSFNKKGDGLITDNKMLVPVVTVADCVPLFLYDSKNGVFAAVHSGWKGTGIIGEAVRLAVEKYGSKPEDICVAIGPHIGSECYSIDENRKNYFLENFGECVTKLKNENSDSIQKTADGKLLNYSLDLTKANLFVLKKAGIMEENITVATDCTCCSKFSDGKNVFGSFRRQAAFLPESVSLDEKSRAMTVQAAFVI